MLDNFYYESSDGAYKVNIGQDGIYVCTNDIRDYSWSYTEEGSILNFKKSLGKKKLPLLFAGKDYDDCAKLRDQAFYIFERDVKLGKRGRIWINGYWLDCFITGSTNKGIIRTRFLNTTFEIVTDGIWHKERTYQFVKIDEGAIVEEVDFPHDFPYDLGYSAKKNRQVIKNNGIVNSDFIITIYGPCVDPLIEIAGHKYGVNGSVSETERLEVTSIENQKNTILKYAQDGSHADWFGHRYKEESAFEKIPEGNVSITWPGTFGFDLNLIEARSEPNWYTGSEERPIEPVTGDIYLLDSEGGYIIDSDGAYIEVSA